MSTTATYFDAQYTAAGDILSTNVERIRAELERVVQIVPDGTTCTIDLRATRLVDSVGLNLIVSIIKAARARQVRIRLVTAHPNLHRILTFTRLGQHAELLHQPVTP